MSEGAHRAEVVSVSGGSARVRFKRTSMCGHCGLCGMRDGDEEIIIEARNAVGASEGDTVEVTLPASGMLSAGLWAYAMPLCLLIVGVAAGMFIGPTIGLGADVSGAALGLVLAAAGFLLLRLLEPRFRRSGRYRPTVVKIVDTELDQ